MIILISGHGGCGKDTLAEGLSRLTGLKTIPTSRIILKDFWHEVLSGKWSESRKSSIYPRCQQVNFEPDQYTCAEDFWEDRVNHRMAWKAYIGSYNMWHDPQHGIATYKKVINEGYSILTGVRQLREFKQIKKVFPTLSFWINRPITTLDPTQEYDSEECDHTISNIEGAPHLMIGDAYHLYREYVKFETVL